MTEPPPPAESQPQPPQAESQPQSPLSEAVEQAADTVGKLVRDIGQFAVTEADKLADRKYGLPDLATAPVRLLSILVNNAFAAASTTSDNLTLLSLASDSAPPPRRTFQVRVPDRVLPRGVTLRSSDLVGQLTHDRIPGDRVKVVPAATGVVTIDVRPLFARPDTYAGTLLSTDGQTVRDFLVAITELGVRSGGPSDGAGGRA